MKMSPQASWRMAALMRRKAARVLPSRAYRYREMARDFEWLARAKAKVQQEATIRIEKRSLLDIWLKDNEFVYPAARKLASRGVPFAFVTARATDGIDPAFADRPLIPKPMDENRVKGWLEGIVSGRCA
jgi:hypothetical protein